MPTKILVKRGTSSNFTAQALSAGEPAFLTDIGKLYLGDGTKKVLINPIDKPSGIVTTKAFSKVQVNEYGQIVGQLSLTAQDIPNIAATQVTGLGTAALVNTGTSTGQIPTLEASGKFPSAVIPPTAPPGVNNMYAYYAGADILVGVNQIVPFNIQVPSGTGLTLNANGGIGVSVAGTYQISYHVSSTALLLKAALSVTIGDTIILTGSTSMSSTSAATPFTTVSASIIRPITTSETIYVKNIGPAPVTCVATSCNICVVRIA